jgi:uncharacterized ferredoxin-like protein
LIEALEKVRTAAKLRHEAARTAARARGRTDFPAFPYECSAAFELEFFRKHVSQDELAALHRRDYERKRELGVVWTLKD